MLVPPINVLLVPSAGRPSLEKMHHVIQLVLMPLKSFSLIFLKTKAMEKNRYGAVHRKWGRQHESAARRVLFSIE